MEGVMAEFEILPRICLERLRKGTSLSVIISSLGARFELRISRVQRRNATYSTAAFGFPTCHEPHFEKLTMNYFALGAKK
jgi:hypothetical protein